MFGFQLGERECVYRQHDHTAASHSTASQPVLPRQLLEPSVSVIQSPGDSHQMSAQGMLSPPQPQQGYFDNSHGNTTAQQDPNYQNQTSTLCFKFATFPWVGLTPMDRHVLSSTESSLKSKDSNFVASSCEFLSDVVIQDFPPELFLQRPHILKTLLSLLKVSASEPAGVVECALQALCDLLCYLKARMNYHQDPAYYTPKIDFSPGGTSTLSGSLSSSHTLGSSDTRPSVIGHTDARHRGDGQDGDNGSNDSRASNLFGELGDDAVEEMDTEDMLQLQFLQWTVPQLCTAVLEGCAPLLKSTQERLCSSTLRLMRQVLELMHEAVSVSVLWQDTSMPARELIEKLQECMEQIAGAIMWHHHGNLGRSRPASDLGQHRVTYTGASVWLKDLITSVIPVEMAAQAIPENVVPALVLLCHDESLTFSNSDVRESLLPYLQELDAGSYNSLQRAAQVCQSMRSTCSFLVQWQEKCEDNILELTRLAEESLESLQYHRHPLVVETCVNLSSYIHKKCEPNPLASQQSNIILLKLLAHPLQQIRLQAYTSCLHLVKDCLGIESVAGPTSSITQGANFLLDSQVLYQFCSFGMNEENQRICEVSQEILLYLLQSQLLLKATRWQQLLEALTAILPVLQGFSSISSSLGKCILGLLDTGSQTDPTMSLPLLERFRGTLRLMFSKDTRVRSEGLARLVWFLTNEEQSHEKRPAFDELDVTNLSNLFYIEDPRHLVDEDTGRSVFTVDGMKKVYDIFVSGTMEQGIRKSAAEQLALMLSDPALHKMFFSWEGHREVMRVIQDGVRKMKTDADTEEAEEEQGTEAGQCQDSGALLSCMVTILRHLLQHSPSFRHQLAHTKAPYHALLRCGLLLHTDEQVKYEVAHVLALLLFDEMATLEQGSDTEDSKDSVAARYSLPSFIVDRYQLPIKPAVHHKESPHTTPLAADPDPLSSGSLAEMLRYTWNVAWHDGIPQLIKASDQAKEEESDIEYNIKLKLSDTDKIILKVSHVPSALQQCLHDISNATNHSMVSQALLRVKSHLVVGDGKNTMDTLHALPWCAALERFFKVMPNTVEDQDLLQQILSFVSSLLEAGVTPPYSFLEWLGKVLVRHQGALSGLLADGDTQTDKSSEAAVAGQRRLNRQLLKFIGSFVGKIPYHLCESVMTEFVDGNLTEGVLNRLNLADATRFYNLASLESTLCCLMHITARPGWSLGSQHCDSLTLCLKMLTSLLEVVSAFHIGRAGALMSYMGRGVTRCATICLRHLTYEMATQLHSQDWPRNWLFSRQATPDSVGESGLHWLIPLWGYRDAEVRAAGLGIAVGLTTTEAGRITMTTQCQHIPGGIWGAAFSILLDHAECSIVREQAALLLVNLTSKHMPSGSVETAPNVWQGPVVRNEETQVSLVGLSALLALLHHSHFYPEMAVILSNYYPQPAIHPISVAPSSPHTTVGSQSTLTTMVSPSMQTSGGPSLQQTSTPASQIQRRPSLVGDHTGTSDAAATDDQAANGSGRRGHASGQEDPSATANTPATLQGVSALHDASASTITTAASSQDYQSVTTPAFVSAVCTLLRNLVCLAPEDALIWLQREGILKTLMSFLDATLLEAYLKEIHSNPYAKQCEVTFNDLIDLYSQVIQLLQVCVVEDSATREQLLSEPTTLKHLLQLLSIRYESDPDVRQCCEQLWQQVYRLLLVLLQTAGPHQALQCLTPVLVKHWRTLTASAGKIFEERRYQESPLLLAAQQFLAVLFVEEARLPVSEQDSSKRLSQILDTPTKQGSSENGDVFSNCTGAHLCQSLIKVYDTVSMKPFEQTAVFKLAAVNSLKGLLAVSASAKMAALEAGLVESIANNIRHLHVQLSLDALELNRAGGNKKKENPLLVELTHTLELLRNFMHQNQEVKQAACECNVAGLLHGLWAWCQLEQSLMSTVLATLAVYVAGCPQACSSLAFTSAMAGQEKAPVKGPHSPNSLVHALIKLVQKSQASGNSRLKKSIFNILATLTFSQECRGILWKSNFLQEFSKFSTKKTKGTMKETLWLDVFVNLSFSTEGQQMMLKIQGCVELLIEMGNRGNQHHQRCCLLILRNMCCHAGNKPKLLTNEKLLPFFLQQLNGESDELRNIASSALWGLLYNNQKAKVALKSGHFMKMIQHAYNNLLNQPANSHAEPAAQNLHNVITELRQ